MKKKSVTNGLFFGRLSTILQMIIFISFFISFFVILQKKPDFFKKNILYTYLNHICYLTWFFIFFCLFFYGTIGFIKCLIKLSFIAKVWILNPGNVIINYTFLLSIWTSQEAWTQLEKYCNIAVSLKEPWNINLHQLWVNFWGYISN